MSCPYCNGDMKLGVIHGDRFVLKWIDKEKDDNSIFYPLVKGIKLSNKSNFNSVEAYLCEKCKKVIIDIPNDL